MDGFDSMHERIACYILLGPFLLLGKIFNARQRRKNARAKQHHVADGGTVIRPHPGRNAWR